MKRCGTWSTISAICRQKAAWARRKSLKKKPKNTNTCRALLATTTKMRSRTRTNTERTFAQIKQREQRAPVIFYSRTRLAAFLESRAAQVSIQHGSIEFCLHAKRG